jgi:chromosome partitioning protein
LIVSVLNQKGGVGKTTITLNLGAALADAGCKILLADLDLQRDLAANKKSPLQATGIFN